MGQENHIKTALRLPPEVHGRLHAAAAEAGRSYNAEIVARLQASFEDAGDVQALRAELELMKARVEHHRYIAQSLDATRVLLASVYLQLAARVGKTNPEALVKKPMLDLMAEWLSAPNAPNEVRSLLALVQGATPEVIGTLQQLADQVDSTGVAVEDTFYNARTGDVVAPPTPVPRTSRKKP